MGFPCGIFNPDDDGKTKPDHMQEMFDNAIKDKKLRFRTVLMDSWYATQDVMKHIHRAGKQFYCPFKSNRLVDDSAGQHSYKAVRVRLETLGEAYKSGFWRCFV